MDEHELHSIKIRKNSAFLILRQSKQKKKSKLFKIATNNYFIYFLIDDHTGGHIVTNTRILLSYLQMGYQTLHLCSGFIGEPFGQLKSFANASELLSGPITRNRFMGCSSVVISNFLYLSRLTSHHN